MITSQVVKNIIFYGVVIAGWLMMSIYDGAERFWREITMARREGLPESYEPSDTGRDRKLWAGCLLVLLALAGLLIWAILLSEDII